MESAKLTQYVSEDIVYPVENAGMFDINALLEFMHTNNDVNLQVKLFASLATYIVSNDANIAVIITYNSLYDKICNLLTSCPPRKASILFNFLAALVCSVDEDSKRNSLIAYAKNMIRSSGCLAIMCKLFTNCMMHQDTWRSLCRCLAETCRNMEPNQSYCTHLVPTCVQRCSQSNMEVLLVLQTLIQNHSKNASLFIECNGMSIFRREFLRHDICLQVLNTFVQSSEQAVELINQTEVRQYLREFLRLYGPQSQLGQWATIILYHISETKGTWEASGYKHQIPNTPEKMITEKSDSRNSTDTIRLYKNVVNEIMQCGLFPAQSQQKQKQNLYVRPNLIQNQMITNGLWAQNTSSTFNKNNIRKHILKSSSPIDARRNKKRDLSFSFLFEENKNRPTAAATPSRNMESYQTEFLDSANTRKVSSELCDFRIARERYSCHKTPDLSTFTPKFVSTPKKQYNDDTKKSITQYIQNSTRRSISKAFSNSDQKRGIRRKKVLPKDARVNKRLEQTTVEKEKRNRSISGWFMDAVNESCTTLVKTVKHIFRPKNKAEESVESKAKSLTPMSTNSASCNYSFTNYMRKRDIILNNEREFSMEMSNSCNTCNNTIALRQKLNNDEYLKQTVRKLKVGINLYGCDFKKISKQLWPQDTYMTPVVLYNLYRKLIIK